MDQAKLREIGIGEAITGFYALRTRRKRDYEGKCYLIFEFGDSSGRIAGVYWGDDAVDVYNLLEKTEVVKIQGTTGEYRGKSQIKVNRIRPARPDEFDFQQLLPGPRTSQEDLAEHIQDIIESISNPHLRQLLERIFNDGDFLPTFLSAPAGKLWHGAYIGGLAEHSVNVAAICDNAAGIFDLCHRDLLISGAILHDIGKVEELAGKASLDYTIPGRLIGHIVLGERFVRRVIESIDNFPVKLADEISHMIVSHHGEGTMGSPIEPKTLEASILHYADRLESEANALSHVIDVQLPNGEVFSDWIRPIERHIYLEPYRTGSAEEGDSDA